jgi:tetratricopeptide (TPR) repeat protein
MTSLLSALALALAALQAPPVPDYRRDLQLILLVGPDPVVAAADVAWSRRDQGRVGARASPTRISEAISGYEKAAESPENVEARWKLARALFFRAKYTGLAPNSQRAAFVKARDAGEKATALLRRRSGNPAGALPVDAPPQQVASALSRERDAASTYFWTAVAGGEWGLLAGRYRAAKAGAATKVRDYAATVIALDPTFEEGGGYRVLGRLHHRAPRIPYVTGWVSRGEAVRNLRLAVQVAPRNFVNRHFLAEALADQGGAGRAEAIRIEEEILADAPSPGHLVEDASIQAEARKNLAAWGLGSGLH